MARCVLGGIPVLPAFERLVRVGGLVGRTVLDLLLPPECLTCDVPVAEQGQLCVECFRRTSFVTDPLCRRCGVPFAFVGQGGPDRLCPECRRHPPRFNRARAAMRYDEQSKKIVLGFKYADRIEHAMGLARHMARAGAALLRDADLLVPVPLHRRRLLARRYNQSALLAKALARLSDRPALLDGLQRIRATESLGERSAAERAQIVAGAIAVRPSRAARITGRRVLLIDDVMTSGSTANVCAEALRAAGATGVDVLVAARAPDPRLS